MNDKIKNELEHAGYDFAIAVIVDELSKKR